MSISYDWIKNRKEKTIENSIRLKKEELIDGCIYRGYCRNAEEAIWNKAQDCFLYKEYIKGSKTEYSWTEIKHIDDERNPRIDAFIPKVLKLSKM